MPNCDFYAVGADFEAVLGFVFADASFRVYESYSPYGHELAEFRAIDEVARRYPLGRCDVNSPSVLLQLAPILAGGEVKAERIELLLEGRESFRYTASGWGLIQLYLGGVSPTGIVLSHSNHNSEARARAWEPTDRGKMGSVAAWNWQEVTRASSRLNRHIRKTALAKVGSRPVLPQAAALLASGTVVA